MFPNTDAELITDFRAFVQSKVEADPEGTYDFQEFSNCAFAQYLRARGVPFNMVLITIFRDDLGEYDIPEYLVPLLGVDCVDRNQYHRWADLLYRIDTGKPAE